MRRNAGALIGGMLVAAALLAGCSPAVSAPVPSATPTPTAVAFATDAEALAAAEQAYRAYQSAVDTSLQLVDATGLQAVAVDLALSNAVSSVDQFEKAQAHQVGAASITGFRAAKLDLAGDGQIYACLRLAGVEVLDSTGSSIAKADRPLNVPMIATIVLTESGLKVSRDQVWAGGDVC